MFLTENIKYLREQAEMTQEDMANLLGFKSQCSISLVEKGERQLSLENLEKISDFFGVTMDQLVKKDLSKESRCGCQDRNKGGA